MQQQLRKYNNYEALNAVMDQGADGLERLKVTTTGEQGSSYDNAEFTVLTGVTNYDVKATQAALWSNVANPRVVSIRTDKTITVKFNSTSNAGITVTSNDSPFETSYLTVNEIYITNTVTGSTASVKILMM